MIDTEANAIICDLDGCLVPIEGRMEFIDKEDWVGFHNAADNMPPNPWCIEILSKFAKDGYQLIFISGRPDKYYNQTNIWIDNVLSTMGIDDKDYYLYLNDTNLPDNEFKVMIYNEKIKPNYKVLFVIEDRQRVVDAWRMTGLICLQPNNIPH